MPRAGRISLVLAVVVGCLTAGCIKTADVVDAALMRPVLREDFESPVVPHAQVYRAGQSIATAANTWEVLSGTVELINVKGHPDTPAFNGQQAVHVTGSGEAGLLVTSVPTQPKRQYTLTFHFARHRLLDPAVSHGRVEVLGAGTTLLEADFTHEEEAFDSYRRYSGTFTADSPQTRLRFSTKLPDIRGITLDGIVIWAVPPPLPSPPRILP